MDVATTQRTTTRSFCRVCLTACGVQVETEGEHVVRVSGDPEHPVSRGYTCAKGRALPTLHHAPDRLDDPRVRRDGALQPTTWDDALDDLAGTIRRVVDEDGPDAIATYIGFAASVDSAGREYVARFFRALRSRSVYSAMTVDLPCKPLVSALLGGHPGLVPVPDWDDTTMLVLVGSNPVVSHGQFSTLPMPRVHLRNAAERGEVWVIDPRSTETSALANRHLRPRPGTDSAILGHAVRELLRDGADTQYLADHARGVERLRAAVERFDETTTENVTGIDRHDLADFVAALRRHGRFAGQTGTGATMSAGANTTEWLLWALGAVTGSLDRPRGSWFHPGFLHQHDRRSSYRPFDATAGRGPESRPDLPRRLGEYPCAALPDEVEAGNVRVLFAVGGNPLTAVPGAERLRDGIASLEAFSVLDVRRSPMTDMATHQFPSAGQLEREDVIHYTDTNLMRVSDQHSPRIVPPAAQRRPSWWIFAALAERLGLNITPEGRPADDLTDRDVLREFASRGRVPFDELVEAPTAILAEPAVFGWVTDRVLAGRGWEMAPEALVSQLDEWHPARGLVAIPRRQPDRVNSQAVAEPAVVGTQVHVHPLDASRLGLREGGLAKITATGGHTTATVKVTDSTPQGAVSLSHGDATTNMNALVGTSVVDPLTGMAQQSGLPVELQPVELPSCEARA